MKLPAEVQVALRDGHISMGHARALINLQDDKQQLLLLQQMIDHELNVRQVEAMVRKIQLPAEKRRPKK